MMWKTYMLDDDANPDVYQWEELLGKSPWDFVEAPQWSDGDDDDAALPAADDARPDGGSWATNPMTGVKVWVPEK